MVCSASESALLPPEAALLVAFIKADYDLSALITSQSLTDEQAIDFVSSPAIQARLGQLCKFTDRSDHLFNSKYRRSAIKALNLVIERQSEPKGDPVELRKAATSLLRRTESPERSSSSSSTSTSARTSSSSSPLSSNPQSEIQNPNSPSRAARLNSSPDTILRALADSASRLDTAETTAILKSTLAEDAKADNEPITDESFHYSRGNRAIRDLTNAVGHVHLGTESSNTRATCTIAAVNGEGTSIPIYLDFERINLTSASERWRITALRRAGYANHNGNRNHNDATDTS